MKSNPRYASMDATISLLIFEQQSPSSPLSPSSWTLTDWGVSKRFHLYTYTCTFTLNILAAMPSLFVSCSRFYAFLFLLSIQYEFYTHFALIQCGLFSCVCLCEFLYICSTSKRVFFDVVQQLYAQKPESCHISRLHLWLTNLPWPSVSDCSRFIARQMWW